MLSDADRNEAAGMLLRAERDCSPVRQLSTTWPAITIDDAYATQAVVQGRKIRDGRRLVGYKVGVR